MAAVQNVKVKVLIGKNRRGIELLLYLKPFKVIYILPEFN